MKRKVFHPTSDTILIVRLYKCKIVMCSLSPMPVLWSRGVSCRSHRHSLKEVVRNGLRMHLGGQHALGILYCLGARRIEETFKDEGGFKKCIS